MVSNASLLQQIKNFRFESGTPDFPFVSRLARDNGWSLTYAQNVVSEYLRFIYLCAISEEILTPSDSVDQAWHLHLSYSHSYWIALCRDILGKPLQHNPTIGGDLEAKKYAGAYERTLQLYQDQFNEIAPREIWPPTSERFSNVNDFRRINTNKHFVISKQSVAVAGITLIAILASMPVYAESSLLNGVLGTLAVVIGLPLLVVGVLWLIKANKNRDGGGWFGCGGGGCGGGGCGC